MRLNTRRLRSDLVETFKIINGKYSIDSEKLFEFDDGNRRGHSKKLFKRRSRLNLRKFVFSNRVIDHWNGLSDSCVNCSTINNFKSRIKVELELEPCQSTEGNQLVVEIRLESHQNHSTMLQ